MPSLATNKPLEKSLDKPEPPPVSPVVPRNDPVVQCEPDSVISQIIDTVDMVDDMTDVVREEVGAIKAAVEAVENEWHVLLPRLNLGGMTRQLAEHCLLESVEEEQVTLLLDVEGSNLQAPRTEEPLAEALCLHLGRKVRLVFKVGAMQAETPDQRRLRVGRELQERARQVIEQDPFVRQLQERFGALIVPGSIRPHTDQ